MALVLFESRVNFLNVATPSNGGFIVGYDTIDGILKQKNHLGVLSPIAGSSSPGTLLETLAKGRNTGNYSITLGDGQKILSEIGTAFLKLSENNVQLSINARNDSYLNMNSSETVLMGPSSSASSAKLLLGRDNAVFQSSNNNSSEIGNSKYTIKLEGVKVLEFSKQQVNVEERDKISVLISSKNSSINTGVYNTVVLGGESIIGATSNSVYVPNIYVKNDAIFSGNIRIGTSLWSSQQSIPSTFFVKGTTASIIKVVGTGATFSGSKSIFEVNDTNVTIGTSQSTTKLNVYGVSGSFVYKDTTQSNGFVLTSDSNGVATWKEPKPQKTINSSSVTLDDTYNGVIVKVKANSTITIPKGLIKNFNCIFITYDTITATFIEDDVVTTTLLPPTGRKLDPYKMVTLFKDTDLTDTYILQGDLTS